MLRRMQMKPFAQNASTGTRNLDTARSTGQKKGKTMDLNDFSREMEDYYFSRYGRTMVKKADPILLEEFCSLLTKSFADMSEEDFYQFLRDHNFTDSNDNATLIAIDRFYLKTATKLYDTPYGRYVICETYVTGAGQVCIVEAIRAAGKWKLYV